MNPTTGGAAAQLAALCLPQVPRALALMDRDMLSPTYGSMDRAYWYYRTLTNFPGAVWQQPMVGFAALSRAAHPENPLAGDRGMLEAARAALLAWARAQHVNGAFDEWYRNEYSYCPTAITAAGAALTLRLLGADIDAASREQALAGLRRAGEWLVPRFNGEVMNQNLAAAAALAGLAALDGPRWRGPAERLLQRIAAEQSPEGWFPEYGGCDFGYSLLALDLLAASDGFGLSEIALPMAARLSAFLSCVLDADRAVPGRLGSRGTAHAFPFGAIAFAPRLPAARAVADRLLTVHAMGVAAGPAGYDDRYFAYFAFPQYCLAYHAAAAAAPAAAATAESAPASHSNLPDSGLAMWRSSGTTVVVNHRLGGAVAVLRAGVPALYHLGYTVSLAGKRYSSAGWHSEQATALMPSRGDAGRAAAVFSAVSSGIPLRWLTLPFQLVVHALVSGRLAEAFQALVKRRMIHPARAIPMTLDRRYTIDGAVLRLDDVLRPAGPLAIDQVAVTDQPTMHSPSARQDGATSVALAAGAASSVRDALRAGHTVTLRWTVLLDRGQGEMHVDARPESGPSSTG